ncbi:TRAP transporter substrate-binding protein [Sulfurospirillum sp. T05]|uniref:TRAP transporter substrate-binding protein n=1 Tax=Sulfurospirillum tamanense TaxID=2813362 RepID=A0ABS2WQE7_9BACT|nr:TRAP transporter substrate-binding protein [Sulfurospirillum tamanensis]MBN2963623.1 TRAP transporter substrate-binding protein [Sulfurospirillum tamanensis]
MQYWRRIVATLVLAVAVLTSASASERKIVWKLAMTWGGTLHPFTTSVESMAKMVETMSDGNFIIRIDSANRHKSPFGVLDMVKAGQYEMAHSASYYWKGKDVNLLPFTSMPFGMTAPEQYAWFYYGGGMELMQKAYAPHNMYSFPGGNTGAQMGGWFRKEIKTLEDLKGLKMRIPGFAGEVLAELGTVVTNIAPGELYTALERGTIDALEWVGPGMDIKLGFHKVAPYYYTGWHEPATELQYLVNQKAYEALPEKYKEMLRVAMRVAAYDMYALNYHESSEAWAQIATEFPHIKIETFSPEIMNAMKAANQKLLKEMSDANPLFKEAMESQAQYLKKVRVWTKMSDFDYLKDNL